MSKWKIGTKKRAKKSGRTKVRAGSIRPTRKRFTGRHRLSANRNLNPFPNVKYVMHKYVDNITMPAATAAGFVTAYQFRANSMFDPDYTSNGHQPMFRDEMADKYKHYTVMYSNIRVTWPQGINAACNRGVFLLEDISYPLDNPTEFLEGWVKNTPLARTTTYAIMPQVSKASYSAPKFYKTTKKGILGDEDKRTAVGNNPAFSPIYTIYAMPVDGSTTLAAAKLQVEMYFVVAWRDKKDFIQS